MPYGKIIEINKIRFNLATVCLDFNEQASSVWIPHGPFTCIDNTGRIILEITYENGLAHGHYADFWANGHVACKGVYMKGKQHGNWYYFNKDRSLSEIIYFDNGLEISSAWQ
jgi:hypothetical protein